LSFGARHRPLRALPAFETWGPLPVHRPRFTTLPRLPHHSPAALARAVLPVARQLRPDVIDAQFFWPDGPAAALLSRELDIPFSIKARGADIQHWGVTGRTAAQVREAGQAAGGSLAVSEALRDVMIGLGLPGTRIAVHRTGIDRDRFHPGAGSKAALGVAGPLLISAGALVPRKRHHLAIQAMAHLPGATLLVVGEGPERPALEREIARLGVADRVRLTGPKPHAELPALFAAADALVLMSESEGLANVWVEALACGTPIIVPDIGGASEVLSNPQAGALAAAEPEAVAAAVRAILAAPPPRDAVARAADPFSWERNAAELEAHLRRVAIGE